MTVFIVIPAAAVLLILWAVCPALRRHPDRELLRGKMIAHRGLHDLTPEVPENSMAAFRLAKEHGYPIETDIHLTRDGEVIVFHDDTMQRMCGRDVSPESLTLSEIRSLTLADTEERIPTLRELLAEIDGSVPLLIEFKCLDRKTCTSLCEAAAPILDAYRGPYLVQSFFPFVLAWFRKHRPGVCRGQLSSAFPGDCLSHRLLGFLIFDFLGRPDFISYEFKYGSYFPFRLVKALGAMPVGWTFAENRKLEQQKTEFDAWIFEGFVPDGAGCA